MRTAETVRQKRKLNCRQTLSHIPSTRIRKLEHAFLSKETKIAYPKVDILICENIWQLHFSIL